MKYINYYKVLSLGNRDTGWVWRRDYL